MRVRIGIALAVVAVAVTGCSSDSSSPSTRPSFPDIVSPTVPEPSTDGCTSIRPTQTTLTSTGPNDSIVSAPVPLTFELAVDPGKACPNGSVQLTVTSTNAASTPVDARLAFILSTTTNGSFWDLGVNIEVHVDANASSTTEVTLGIPNYVAPGGYLIGIRGAPESVAIAIAAPG